MQLLKTHLLSILFILPWFSHAQLTIKDIPSNFTLYEFYPDSSIKTIYATRNDKLQGWSIEFNEKGEPTGIGKYKNNQKKGVWRYSNLSIIDYKKSCYREYTPPYCGISDMAWEIKFDKIVNKHFYHKK